MVEVFEILKQVTVDPPIKDTPNEGQPLYKGHCLCPPRIYFLRPKEDNLSAKDILKVSFVQRFH